MESSNAVAALIDAIPGEVRDRIEVLWGKQKGGFALLLGHMLDTAAVAEQIWDHYASTALRSRIEEAAGHPNTGRQFFAFACGIHDVGKATPSFQRQVTHLWDNVKSAGLDASPLLRSSNAARHSDAGGRIAHDLLLKAGWSDDAAGWVCRSFPRTLSQRPHHA
ncbi:MAG: CRISPR-associated endonuclease Cas3'' [Bifidobacteriaceae bacterium]|jgi:CRISPR-associated endonuclease/helicase Cas3|nr:CRISPR-associated endonuclease Cas3'' [Bifidobacteriaceae bacterium]